MDHQAEDLHHFSSHKFPNLRAMAMAMVKVNNMEAVAE
jgi:hypothetical protein